MTFTIVLILILKLIARFHKSYSLLVNTNTMKYKCKVISKGTINWRTYISICYVTINIWQSNSYMGAIYGYEIQYEKLSTLYLSYIQMQKLLPGCCYKLQAGLQAWRFAYKVVYIHCVRVYWYYVSVELGSVNTDNSCSGHKSIIQCEL